MNSSLHPLAATPERRPRRLPVRAAAPAGRRSGRPRVIVMGQEAEVFARAGIGQIEDWDAGRGARPPPPLVRQPATGTLAVLLASTSDLDDLIPTLVAYQIEWNKLHALLRAAERPEGDEPDPPTCAEAFGGAAEDWTRVARGLARRAGRRSSTRSATRRLNLRIRMLGGSQVGLRAHDAPLVGARCAPRWTTQGLGDRADLLRLLQHRTRWSTSSPATARASEDEIVAFVEARRARLPARGARALPRRAATEGSWENFLYFARAAVLRGAARGRRRRGSAGGARERELGVTHLSSRTGAARVGRRSSTLDRLDPAGLDPRLGADRRRAARAVRRA